MTRPTDYTDGVAGFVVGDMTPYEFWMPEEIAPGMIVDRCLARGHFSNDDEAVAWFRSQGIVDHDVIVEMRVFDQ